MEKIKLEKFGPKVEEVEPEVEEFTPEVKEFAPEVEEFVPEVEEFVPEGEQFAPEGEEFALEVEDIGPKVEEIEPEDESEVDPEVEEMKSKVEQAELIHLRKYNKFFVFSLVLNSCLGSFFFGYQVGDLNSLQQLFVNAIYPDDMTSIILGLCGALVSAGAMMGAISAGSLANKIGRKNAIYITDLISILGVAMTMIKNIPILLTGRLICGVAVGLNSAIVPLYINEISPLAINSITGIMNQIFISLGVFVAYIMAYGIPYTNKNDPTISDNYHYNDIYWRITLGLPGAVAFLRSLILKIVLPYDTPRYLVLSGQKIQAEIVLNKIYSRNEASYQLEELKKQQITQNQKGKMIFKDLISPIYRKRLLIGCVLSVLQQLSGINALSTYSSNIFIGDGDMTSEKYGLARNYTTIFGAIGLIVPTLCSLMTSKVGRKTLLLIGTAICALSLAIFAFTYAYIPSVANIGVFCYMAGYGISLGPIVWMYIPEILPDLGVGVAVLANWLTSSIVIQVFPMLPLGSYNFLIFAAFCALGLVFIAGVVKETLRKTPLEIEQMYCDIQEEKAQELVTIDKKKLSVLPLTIPKTINLQFGGSEPGSADKFLCERLKLNHKLSIISNSTNDQTTMSDCESKTDGKSQEVTTSSKYMVKSRFDPRRNENIADSIQIG